VNHTFVLFTIVAPPLLALGIGVLYFVRSNTSSPTLVRLLTSAYAPTTALLFGLAAVLPRNFWYSLGRDSFLVAQAVPAALLLYSLGWYPGKRALHVVAVPLCLLLWFAQIAWGTTAIYGK
jgi:hypothetical protein